MARLLVLAFDTHNPDVEKDKFAWKTGHVVSIRPDKHVWGKKECLPRFYQIDLPNVSVEDVKKYLDPALDKTDEKKPINIGIRQYKMDLSRLTTSEKTTIEADGKVELTTTKLSSAMVDTWQT